MPAISFETIQEEPIMLEESGLLVVFFRVRTTLLRSAFSLSSLSRRASSSGLTSAFCGAALRSWNEKAGERYTHLGRVHPVSLPLGFRLSLDPYSRRRTVWGAEITSFALTFVAVSTLTRAPRPASAPARWPFHAPPVLCAPTPTSVLTSIPLASFPTGRRPLAG